MLLLGWINWRSLASKLKASEPTSFNGSHIATGGLKKHTPGPHWTGAQSMEELAIYGSPPLGLSPVMDMRGAA